MTKQTLTLREGRINATARQQLAEPQRTDPDKEFTMMGSKEVAAFLGFTVRTIERWRKAKIGPEPIRVGGRLYYTKDRLKTWQRNGSNTSKPWDD